MPHHEHPYQKQYGLLPEARVVRLVIESRDHYHETCRLLEEKLLNAVRLNSRLQNSITSRYHLVEVLADGIHIHLAAFSSDYHAKFISADLPTYCYRFMQQMEPVLQDYHSIFHHHAISLERYTHIINSPL